MRVEGVMYEGFEKHSGLAGNFDLLGFAMRCCSANHCTICSYDFNSLDRRAVSLSIHLADIHWRGNCGKKREQYRNRHADSEDPNKFRKASEIVIILCSMAVVVVFLVGSWNLIEKTKGVYYSTMPFLSTGWQYAAPVVGFGLILFYFILRLVSIVTGKPIATVKGLDLEEAGKEANE